MKDFLVILTLLIPLPVMARYSVVISVIIQRGEEIVRTIGARDNVTHLEWDMKVWLYERARYEKKSTKKVLKLNIYGKKLRESRRAGLSEYILSIKGRGRSKIVGSQS